MKVLHEKSRTILGKNVVKATSFWRRLRGYIFYKSSKLEFDGLFFQRSNCIHNCFVRFPIDAVFVNKEFEIVEILREFKPWRFSRIYFKASHVFKFPSETINDSISIGDKLTCTQ